MKLHEIIAVLSNQKKRLLESVSNANKTLQQTGVFDGLIRRYSPKNEDGEKLPDESVKIKHGVDQVLSGVFDDWVRTVDCVVSVDTGNMNASSDIIVDGQTVASNVPATTLIYLEKQLTDWITLIQNVPVLDSSLNWSFDSTAKLFKSEITKSSRTKKVQKPIVLYPATPEHPAQTQLITEDEQVGYWETQKTSQAIPLPRKQKIIQRLEVMRNAVIIAREKANSQECQTVNIGQPILENIFRSEQ